MTELVKYYHPRENPFQSGAIFVERKILSDGSRLELECNVSGIEFVGTPTFKLTLFYHEYGGAIGQMLFPRPESVLLSEPAYRMIMGRINTREDFYRLQQELKPIIDDLRHRLHELKEF